MQFRIQGNFHTGCPTQLEILAAIRNACVNLKIKKTSKIMNRILCHRREIESKNIHRKTYARREGQTWNTRVCPTNECLITTGTANHKEMTFDASVRRETVPSRITPNLEQKVKINPLKSRNYDKMAWTLWKPVWK